MWDLIAYKVYGRENCMKELLEANEEYRHIAIFPSGITLKLPDIEPQKSEILPPWMR